MILYCKPAKLLAFEFGVHKFRYTFKSLAHFEKYLEDIKYLLVCMSLDTNKPASMKIKIKNWNGSDLGFKLIIDMKKEKWDVEKL